eukprot:UN06906
MTGLMQSLFIICFLLREYIALQCLNENGHDVDWWFIYKINHGLSYTYYDALSNIHSFPVIENRMLSDRNTALAYTLTQIWKNSKSYNFIAYNDEPPMGKSYSNYGHTKGILAYDFKHSNGYFLSHSWPKFPNLNGSTYNLNAASTKFGQTFLCISYESYTTMNSIAYQIRYNKPYVYRSLNLFTETNNFTEILSKQWIHGSIPSTVGFNTANHGQYFTLFAKSAKWKNDLYQYVSDHYQQSFIWETWRRHGEEPTFCSP